MLNVWIRTIGKDDDRAVTADTKRGIRNFAWQYDNKHVLYMQDVGGDENWRLYQTDIASKQTKDLTPFEKVRVDLVAYDSKKPDTVLFQANKRDPKVFDVYRVDLKTGKIDMDTENPGDVQGWQADNDLQVRAAQVALADGGTIIRVRNDAKSPWRDLVKWGPMKRWAASWGSRPTTRKSGSAPAWTQIHRGCWSLTLPAGRARFWLRIRNSTWKAWRRIRRPMRWRW